VDRAVEAVLKQAAFTREHLAEVLRKTNTRDPGFPETLIAVRESGLFTVDELAELVGLSRARLYQLMGKTDESS
jgi:hypothetical protein